MTIKGSENTDSQCGRNSALCRTKFTAATAIRPTAAIAVTRAESCLLDHSFEMLAKTAGLIKCERHWSPSGSSQWPKPAQCTLMSLLINSKSHANDGMQRSRTIPLESFGQHSMARARTVCTVVSHDHVKQPAETAGRINDKFPWNLSGSS